MSELREIALNSNAWPFQEARKLVDRFEKTGVTPDAVIFETGYGPSGLPHIGTFGEVARTTMVRRAFETISDIPTRLIAFSDDMDGLRKVPDNIPNKEAMVPHLGKPLTQVPDPFGTHDSFGAHNNARLRAFLDAFGFEYEFMSSTECYKAGRFDTALLQVLHNYDDVINVILPTLGPDRRATYSPFLPVCPRTGQVLQVPVVDRDAAAGTITYEDSGERVTVPVTGGHCKLQWKADWAMRWVALGVHYEMAGKDLIDSVKLSSRICTVLGGTPPEGFNYELFLDENGEKISKSRGNGLTIEEWLRYAPTESLSLYMFQSPRKAKRLYFDVIPKAVDEYITFLDAYHRQSAAAERLANPVWHIHGGNPPKEDVPVTFGLLLNLVSASNSEDPAILWGFISGYAPGATPATHPLLNRLVRFAVAYYDDFVKPAKRFRKPDERERAALSDLAAALDRLPAGATAEEIQNEVYAVGKTHDFEPLRDWFKALYETLLGQSQGPRMGSFFALYGLDNSRALLADALAGKLAA
ncbi:lysine--tRNA ligase [Emcibacter sp. SYSU 3D8]|uniref:lysine--tRNA ligase n=1 Tax=Emcibacter sp. SYSU 3D8 TaxID=3133969 RepID=UPI0031FEEC70